MRRNYLLLGMALLSLFAGCNRDADEVEPREVKNWFRIEDCGDKFGHLAYEVYQDYGIPVFVNDTIGRTRVGEDVYGEPLFSYEILNPRYNMYTYYNNTYDRALERDTAVMMKALEVVGNWVLPNFPDEEGARVKSLLLVDSLFTSDYGGYNNSSVSKTDVSMTAWVYNTSRWCTVVGRLFEIQKMTDRQLKFWAGMILSANVVDWLGENYPEGLDEFYALTDSDHPQSKSFYATMCMCMIKIPSGELVYPNYPEYNSWSCFRMGFLEWVRERYVQDSYSIFDGQIRTIKQYPPSKKIDVMNYVAAVYAFSDEEFAAMTQEVDGGKKCIEKRLIMKDLVAKFDEATGVTRQAFGKITFHS